VKQKQIRCFSLLLLILAARSGAQEYNSVPLDHAAYDIIAMGIMQGIILAPPAAKPWPLSMVKEKLWEMIDDPAQILSSEESETVSHVLDSFERKTGLQLQDGRYRTENSDSTFEVGLGWESDFSIKNPGASFANINMLRLYSGGDMADCASWNISPQVYAGWPDDPVFSYGLEAELNGAFFNQHILLRLGRIPRGWGRDSGESSLFINAHARPFTALEGTILPLSWLNISFLGGALERFDENNQWPHDRPFTNMLSAAQVEFNPSMYIHLNIGGAAVLLKQPNTAFFTDLEFRVPGLFTLWGSLFIDRLNSSSGIFSPMNGNSYAYQAGIKTVIHWLPLAAFTLRYTRIEPYCYAGEWDSAFINGGESLGYYLPPNSDELLLRFEYMLFTIIKTYFQFQMIRHGVDYGYGAVGGSSLYDTLADNYSAKYFLRDGVYQWDNIIKLGGSCNLRAGGAHGVPLSMYAEAGLMVTNFTINGNAGVGNEANNEPLSDSTYQPGAYFIFSIGFRLFL
jgi:hypothetical protein